MMSRRRALKALGALAGGGLAGRYLLLPPGRSRDLPPAHELAVRLYDSLDHEARAKACVEYDHPLRQYHNRGVWGGGLWINSLSLGWEQRRILTDLLYAGLSEAGQKRVPNEFYLDYPGVHALKVLICGSPKAPPYQLILTGPHINLRIGGRSREGAAFGGPLVYGDQRGDGRQGLPGNLYRDQFQIAHRLFSTLSASEKKLALRAVTPIQTDIGLQGSEGAFSGVAIETLSRDSRAIARTLVDRILSTYPAEDVAYAWACLEHNGGLDALFLSYYEDGEVDRSGEYQTFRLEGPAAVFYFRGYPHVHAFINVAMDGDAPLSVGEVIGESSSVKRGREVKALFEEALKEAASTDLAYYDLDSVAGTLRKGVIRTGDIFALESWQDTLVTVSLRGKDFAAPFRQEVERRGIAVDPGREYVVATTGHVVEEGALEKLGRIAARKPGILVRDALIAHLKGRGFSS